MKKLANKREDRIIPIWAVLLYVLPALLFVGVLGWFAWACLSPLWKGLLGVPFVLLVVAVAASKPKASSYCPYSML